MDQVSTQGGSPLGGGEDAERAGPPAAAPPAGARTGWRRWFGAKRVAVMVALLLAAEVGYVVDITSASSSSPQQDVALPPLSTLAPPSSTLPITGAPSAPTTTEAPTTSVAGADPAAGAGSAAVAGAATPSGATPARATAAALGYCTAGDLHFTTTTDSGTYSPGDTVNMTMEVSDVTPCIFQPAPVGATDCPSTLAVVQDGAQVFPNSGYGENCDPPGPQTMNPGSKEAMSASWTIPANWDSAEGPGASYVAIGEWGWSAGPGQPAHSADVGSDPFTIG